MIDGPEILDSHRLQQELVLLRIQLEKAESERDTLRARISEAPRGHMQRSIRINLCAATEEDFPGLYAMQGKRVAVVELTAAELEQRDG